MSSDAFGGFRRQRSMKEITKRLGTVGSTRLPGWGPRDPHCAWLETLQDMAANRCQWRSCCQFLSRLPELSNKSWLYGSEASVLNTDVMPSMMELDGNFSAFIECQSIASHGFSKCSGTAQTNYTDSAAQTCNGSAKLITDSPWLMPNQQALPDWDRNERQIGGDPGQAGEYALDKRGHIRERIWPALRYLRLGSFEWTCLRVLALLQSVHFVVFDLNELRARWLSGYSANLLTGRSVVRTRLPHHFFLGSSNLAEAELNCHIMTTAVTSAAEFAGNGLHTSLPSHCLTASGSLPSFKEIGRLAYAARGQASATYVV
ncbi:hypothetical protein T265_07404 [Opisthorchis viverrini]|uniref:Uncharacterized protein n=1 Tax=Opisthorchis viverrini TaxID=6198 RepID=A0A074ZH94_OPIVI|nr:hypothetical protein T265_07404 [Opisthorchis viverrini]KER25067.1 hypothetical protein T265_07404 [Opisthorchis viverrini]